MESTVAQLLYPEEPFDEYENPASPGSAIDTWSCVLQIA